MRPEQVHQAQWEDAVREAAAGDDARRARWVRNATMAAASIHADETEQHARFAGWLAVQGLLESRTSLDDVLRMGWAVVERIRVLGEPTQAGRVRERGFDPFDLVCLRLRSEALVDLAEVQYYGRRRRPLARHWRGRVRAGRWIPGPAGTGGEVRPGAAETVGTREGAACTQDREGPQPRGDAPPEPP